MFSFIIVTFVLSLGRSRVVFSVHLRSLSARGHAAAFRCECFWCKLWMLFVFTRPSTPSARLDRLQAPFLNTSFKSRPRIESTLYQLLMTRVQRAVVPHASQWHLKFPNGDYLKSSLKTRSRKIKQRAYLCRMRNAVGLSLFALTWSVLWHCASYRNSNFRAQRTT